MTSRGLHKINGRSTWVTTIVVALVALAPHLAYPRTWVLNPSGTGDAPSIQAAIDSTQDADSILLKAGTYLEIFDFRGKDIMISGSGRFNTIIDASSSDGPCATFVSGETNAAVLEHMTLTGGKGRGIDIRTGGAVYIEGAEPILRDLLIEFNGIIAGQTVYFGGGVEAVGKRIAISPIIEDCEIRNNKAVRNGGGLSFVGVVMPTIRRCSIHDNEAQLGDGGGMLCTTSVGAVFERNVVINNKAGDHGGGIYVSTSYKLYLPLVEIAENLVANNVAYGNDSSDLTGGGMMFYGLNANIHHNTIVGNSGRTAGGVTMQMGGRWKLEYNIVANTVNGFGISCDNSTDPEFNHNIAWNNSGGIYCPGWANGTDNLEVDPLFCDPSDSNFSVQETSPALTRFSSYAGYNSVPGCRGRYVWTTWSGIKTRYYH